jgi:hypothetical protein
MLEFDGLVVFDDDKINNGVWLHLINPVDDEPMYLGGRKDRPSKFKVRSTSSKAFDGHLDTVQRRAYDRARQMKGKKGREEMLTQLKKERPESFAALVSGAMNISSSKPDEEFVIPKEDLIAFAKVPKNHWAVDLVLERAADARYYGPGDPDITDDDDEEGQKPGNAAAVLAD